MFITMEGLDGSGKTTQIRLLEKYLRQEDFDVVVTREPGGSRIGDIVREVLLDLGHTELHPRTEALLFNAARAQLIEDVICPALAKGTIVLCDRFADSTLAYQGCHENMDHLRWLIQYATAGILPDLTLYLELPPAEGIRRKRQQGNDWNRLDTLSMSYYQRVADCYKRLIKSENNGWVVIDAKLPREDVHHAVVTVVQKLLSVKVSAA